MLKFGNKEFRNLEEQVEKNKEDIQNLAAGISAVMGFMPTVKGVYATADQIPAGSYNTGDTFLIGSSTPYSVYIYTANDTWQDIGQFPVAGPKGDKGEKGSQILYGNTDPTVAIQANEGDYYINTTSGDWFVKGVAAWSYALSLKGEKGDRGAQGLSGPQGPVGPTGPIGPIGPQGVKGDLGTGIFMYFKPITQDTYQIDMDYVVKVSGRELQNGDVLFSLADATLGNIAWVLEAENELRMQYIMSLKGPQGIQGESGATVTGMTNTGHTTSGTVTTNTIEVSYSDGTTTQFTLDTVGIQGPQGEKGDPGAPGATGPRGPEGPQGEQGIPGEKGATGPAGPKGDKGDPGAPGKDGAPGAIGPQGPQGEIGPRGPQGEQGPQGPEGPIGPQGPKGDKGDPGNDGAQGEQGPAGKDGVTPEISASANVSNTVGTPSVTVTKSGTNEAPTFTFDFKNLKGEQGPQGEQGPKGDKGDSGATIVAGTGISVTVDETAGTSTVAVDDTVAKKSELAEYLPLTGGILSNPSRPQQEDYETSLYPGSISVKQGKLGIGLGPGGMTRNTDTATHNMLFPDKSGTIAVTDDIAQAVKGKQDKLSDTQLSAVNSGITSDKVTTYDGYASKITALESKPGLDKVGTVTSVQVNGTNFNPDATGKVDLGNIGGGGGGGTAEVPVIKMSAESLTQLPITNDIVDKMLNKGYVIQNTLQDNNKVIIRLDWVSAANDIIHLRAEQTPNQQVLISYALFNNSWSYSGTFHLPEMFKHITEINYADSGTVYVHSINCYSNNYFNIDEFVKWVPNFTIAGNNHSYQFMMMSQSSNELTVITDGNAANQVTIYTSDIQFVSDNAQAIIRDV